MGPRLLFALLALAGASCKPSTPVDPPQVADPGEAAEIDRLAAAVRAAGVEVTRTEMLESLREFPACELAELRWRIHFAPDEFVNVSRFTKAEHAQACLEDYKTTALKAGPSGWERLGPLIFLEDRWLFLFPPDMRDGVYRKKIVDALRLAAQNPAPMPR